jgi:hypothetical protein
MTNLPASNEAYERGHEETTTSLTEAMTSEGAQSLSSFAGIVVISCIFGRNLTHLHRTGPYDRPDDPENGEFWKRHRHLESVLSTMLLFLPEHLQIPQANKDPNVPFLNMNIHASVICLHQAAILKAEKHKLDVSVIKTSVDRCHSSAEEIVNIMRLTSHVSVETVSHYQSCAGRCLMIIILDESLFSILSICRCSCSYSCLQKTT